MWNPIPDNWTWSFNFETWFGINTHQFIEAFFLIITCLVLAAASVMQMKAGSSVTSSVTSSAPSSGTSSIPLVTPTTAILPSLPTAESNTKLGGNHKKTYRKHRK